MDGKVSHIMETDEEYPNTVESEGSYREGQISSQFKGLSVDCKESNVVETDKEYLNKVKSEDCFQGESLISYKDGQVPSASKARTSSENKAQTIFNSIVGRNSLSQLISLLDNDGKWLSLCKEAGLENSVTAVASVRLLSLLCQLLKMLLEWYSILHYYCIKYSELENVKEAIFIVTDLLCESASVVCEISAHNYQNTWCTWLSSPALLSENVEAKSNVEALRAVIVDSNKLVHEEKEKLLMYIKEKSNLKLSTFQFIKEWTMKLNSILKLLQNAMERIPCKCASDNFVIDNLSSSTSDIRIGANELLGYKFYDVSSHNVVKSTDNSKRDYYTLDHCVREVVRIVEQEVVVGRIFNTK